MAVLMWMRMDMKEAGRTTAFPLLLLLLLLPGVAGGSMVAAA
jgi:hypothetical protein